MCLRAASLCSLLEVTCLPDPSFDYTLTPPSLAHAVCHAAINEVRTRGESCGGEVTCVVRNCPKGLGSPVFDKLEAELAKAMLSLPATKV